MTFPAPFDLLIDSLQRRGIELEPLPAEVIGPRLKQETWLEALNGDFSSRAARELPAETIGVRLDGVPVLLCLLDMDATFEGLREAQRRIRNQATIARSWLEADATNLQMFLARRPSGTLDLAWEEFASLLEVDDRVCRKLVWLPTLDESGETADSFIARTFLASPWLESAIPLVASLDTMSEVKLPPGWSDVLDDQDLEADVLLRRLAEIPLSG